MARRSLEDVIANMKNENTHVTHAIDRGEEWRFSILFIALVAGIVGVVAVMWGGSCG